ncbi:hypothetical protein [Pseudodesulfovibrio indicus]|uniref:DUF4760 domain-containing protein n=1 Tax=Pseudodesulfovibrio indicus TaxID=1716143 RepID=A0AA94PV48_9BACT|nr:hypothetical protein [Pseudodesulfovibrio indicus]TDT87450.1 hypothetical protein EDC59_108116 [Pseudodesulfovibrio indicus]
MLIEIAVPAGVATFISGIFLFIIKRVTESTISEHIKQEFEIERHRLNRYEDVHYQTIRNLWEMLCDLNQCVDDLWDNASIQNLRVFSSKLRKANLALRKAGPILHTDSYHQIQNVLTHFTRYFEGKDSLILLRESEIDNVDSNHFNDRIRNIINVNFGTRNRLNQVLDSLLEEYRHILNPRVGS